MNNLSVTANIANANLSPIHKSDFKIDPQNQTNFLQVFMRMTPSQTFMVPGSCSDDSISFWKNKFEIETEIPGLEECIEEKIEDIITRISSLINDQNDR